MRGNPSKPAPSWRHRGSIPASAGEPSVPRFPNPRNRVYPRECGGTCMRLIAPASPSGLSPRVRGNRERFGAFYAMSGSIPASAGEPASGFASSAVAGVYPRECGGTLSEVWAVLECPGLSPRVRGNLIPWAIDGVSGGSIPASAGEPCSHRIAGLSIRVYPRECGGTLGVALRGLSSAGLSPRVRGNPIEAPPSPKSPGSIPASAGEPPPPRNRWHA